LVLTFPCPRRSANDFCAQCRVARLSRDSCRGGPELVSDGAARAGQMRKYLHVLNIGIQNQLVYRVNFLFRACFSLLPLIATISLWRAVYAGQEGDVGGYTLAQMISYYLVVTLVDMFTAVNEDDWQIAADIREGNISQFLVKPIDYLKYRLCLFLAGRAIYTAIAIVSVALFIIAQRQYFVAPADAAMLGWFVVSIVMTVLLQFFTSYAMALLAFW